MSLVVMVGSGDNDNDGCIGVDVGDELEIAGDVELLTGSAELSEP